MKKNKTAKTGIIVAILLLAVGFAAITTTLVINGTAKIVPDSENFEKNVIFTEATATEGATATISTQKVKKITEGILTSRRRARERPNLLREVLLRAVIKILNIQRITAKSLIKNSLNRLKTSRL